MAEDAEMLAQAAKQVAEQYFQLQRKILRDMMRGRNAELPPTHWQVPLNLRRN